MNILDPITIPKDSEFFIAICQIDDHSFVTLGASYQENVTLLASFGKYLLGSMNSKKSNRCCLFFSGTHAQIMDEELAKVTYFQAKLTVHPGEQYAVHYKAFAITYENYCEFLTYMGKMSRQQMKDLNSSALFAYCPNGETDTSRQFQWQPVHQRSNDGSEHANVRLHLLNDSCRHSAIHLKKIASNSQELGRKISSLFFIKPPLKTVFSRGQVDKEANFYILPIPPTSLVNLEPKKRLFVIELYDRLEKVMLLNSNSEMTKQKFKALKSLYLSISSEKIDLMQTISTIRKWERDHWDVIKTHRRSWNFGGKTTTVKMFEKFDKVMDQYEKEHFFTYQL